MFSEKTGSRSTDIELLGIKLEGKEQYPIKMVGDTLDRITYKDGRVEEIVGHNIVVNSFLNLVMCLLKKQTGYNGIQYWAVGSGSSSWDNSIPTPELTANRLTAEIGRVEIRPDEISFLDTGFNKISTPSNIIQIEHTFGANDCNGSWREFAIFGGNATATVNSGIMINKRHHAVITKTDEMTVERVMRFTLSLA